MTGDDEKKKLPESIKSSADAQAKQAPDEPDESTRGAIKAEKAAQRQARSVGVRADDLEGRLLDRNRDEVTWLRAEYDTARSRIQYLETQVESIAELKAELASVKSPRALRNFLIAGLGVMAASGAALIACFPKGTQQGWLGLTPEVLFGCGLCFTVISPVMVFLIGQEWFWIRGTVKKP